MQSSFSWLDFKNAIEEFSDLDNHHQLLYMVNGFALSNNQPIFQVYKCTSASMPIESAFRWYQKKKIATEYFSQNESYIGILGLVWFLLDHIVWQNPMILQFGPQLT